MSEHTRWREDSPGLFTEQDGAERIAIATYYDSDGVQHPKVEESWAVILLYSLQDAYGSALKTYTINEYDCVIVDLPEPA